MSSQTFRLLLEAMDVPMILKAWTEWFPNMPRPATHQEAEIVMHHARTQMESLELKHRAYSHKWLLERGLPSGLPDRLKPSAQQICPITVKAVGISVNFRNPLLKPAAGQIHKAMANRVEDCYADGVKDSEIVRKHMLEARILEEKALFGRVFGA